MKVLLITGTDYAASTAESEFGIEEVAKMVKNNEIEPLEEMGIEATLHDFNAVDPAFINFIFDEIMDYDDAKTTNFYVLKGKK